MFEGLVSNRQPFLCLLVKEPGLNFEVLVEASLFSMKDPNMKHKSCSIFSIIMPKFEVIR